MPHIPLIERKRGFPWVQRRLTRDQIAWALSGPTEQEIARGAKRPELPADAPKRWRPPAAPRAPEPTMMDNLIAAARAIAAARDAKQRQIDQAKRRAMEELGGGGR